MCIRDPCEAGRHGIVDLHKGVLGSHPRERRHSRGSGRLVAGAQNAEFELGGGDYGNGDLIWEVPQRAAGFACYEDRGVGNGSAQGSSTSELRTSAKSSSSASSAPACSLIWRRVADGTQGLRLTA